MKIFISLLILSFYLATQLAAQDSPKIKFEKVTPEEVRMTVYEQDTTAAAVILYDEGSSEVIYNQTKGFTLEYQRFVRIKILKQSGTDWGNFSIPLYSSIQNREEIGTIKGITFNFENGKVEKTEMKKDAVFRERENKYWEMIRLSLPAVKTGSVIDLKYSIVSPLLWNLRSWKFQYLIPVKWSQYEVIYPEYFNYNHSSLGYHPLNSQTETTKNASINLTTTTHTNGALVGSGNQRTNESIPYRANVFNYTAKDVPALKTEPYLTTLENYTTKLKFELSNIDLTKIGGSFKNYTSSWNEIASGLLLDDDFGVQIKSANFAKDDIAALTAGKTDEKQKMIALYTFIQQNIKWDKLKSYMPSKSLRKTFNDKTGNSAEINLLLVAMLKESGIEADPVILSTRDNGMVSFVHPTLSDCNYVIARAMINGTAVLLDATEPNLPAGLIPFRCLNGQGRLIKKDHTVEVPLVDSKSVSNTSIDIVLKDGKFTGTLNSIEGGLNAFYFRESVKDASGEKEFFEKLKNKSTDIQFDDYTYSNLDSIYKYTEKKYSIVLQNDTETDADIIYFNPVLANRIASNPFTAPTREYPVDYGVPFTDTYQLSLVIPEGYAVEELPQNKSFGLEGKSGSFFYQTSQVGNRIILSMRLNIEKSLFLPAEYQMLKEFYNLLVSKEAEQIVLKKINKG